MRSSKSNLPVKITAGEIIRKPSEGFIIVDAEVINDEGADVQEEHTPPTPPTPDKEKEGQSKESSYFERRAREADEKIRKEKESWYSSMRNRFSAHSEARKERKEKEPRQKQTGGKRRMSPFLMSSWIGLIPAFLIVAGILYFFSPDRRSTDVDQVEESASISQDVDASGDSETFGIVTLDITPDDPQTLRIAPGLRWDIVGEIPSGWTTDSGYRDSEGYRVQKFEVVPPVGSVSLDVKVSRCATPQTCAW